MAGAFLRDLRGLSVLTITPPDAEGNLLPVHLMPREARAAIAYAEIVVGNVSPADGKQDRLHKIRFYDKPRCLELIGKHLGMLVEKREVGAPGSFRRLSDTELLDRFRALQAKAKGA